MGPVWGKAVMTAASAPLMPGKNLKPVTPSRRRDSGTSSRFWRVKSGRGAGEAHAEAPARGRAILPADHPVADQEVELHDAGSYSIAGSAVQGASRAGATAARKRAGPKSALLP